MLVPRAVGLTGAFPWVPGVNCCAQSLLLGSRNSFKGHVDKHLGPFTSPLAVRSVSSPLPDGLAKLTPFPPRGTTSPHPQIRGVVSGSSTLVRLQHAEASRTNKSISHLTLSRSQPSIWML